MLELSDFDRNPLNNDPGVKSWINTLFYRFKVLTSIAFNLLTDKIYSLEDAHACCPSAQYVRVIILQSIGYNIVNVANQLSFTYHGIAPKLRVFILPPTESTKVSNFIHTLKNKQEVWHEMMATPTAPYRYYNPAQRPLSCSYRSSLPSQYEAFSCYQSQQCMPQAQLSWRTPKRLSDLV